MKILVAHTDMVARSMLETILVRWGHQVVLAETGTQALARLNEQAGPNLAIVEKDLEGQSGLEICKHVRDKPESPYVYILYVLGEDAEKGVMEAIQAGADEALMLDVHGAVSTCNATNFFIVVKGEVWTSTGQHCLNGITRRKVIELCHAQGIPAFEKDFSLVNVYAADEAFVTGTFGGLTPVMEVDGHLIGNGQPGELTRRLRDCYLAEIERFTTQ